MKVAFYTLGCKVNYYESTALSEKFKEKGFEVVSSGEFADVYIVNSCSVTSLSDRKSRQFLRRMKRQNPNAVTVLMGCYPQTNPSETFKIEEADIIMGSEDKSKVFEYLGRFFEEKKAGKVSKALYVSKPRATEKKYDELGPVLNPGDGRSRAVIKIEDGCENFCSYCIIPFARGPVRSRAPENILVEARNLIESGCKEIVIAGINTALYGREKGFSKEEGPAFLLENLLEKLSALPGDFRIRLGSLEPTVIDSEYVKKLFKYEKLCHHLHLSLQSGSDRVLKAMNRHYESEGYMKIVEALRDFDPFYGITTDIIVGFPGESEEDFEKSIEIVKKASFLKVHVFPYSKRPGTAAAAFPGSVDPAVKKERAKRLSAVSEEVSLKFRENLVNTRQKVLAEEDTGLRGEGGVPIWKGYASNYAEVRFPSERLDTRGRFFDIIIEKPFMDGLFGKDGK